MQRMLDIAGITQNLSKPLLVLACECDEFADHVPITLAWFVGHMIQNLFFSSFPPLQSLSPQGLRDAERLKKI
jgi:hypothetical protein